MLTPVFTAFELVRPIIGLRVAVSRQTCVSLSGDNYTHYKCGDSSTMLRTDVRVRKTVCVSTRIGLPKNSF